MIYAVNCVTTLAVEAESSEDAIAKFCAELQKGGFAYRVRTDVEDGEVVLARSSITSHPLIRGNRHGST